MRKKGINAEGLLRFAQHLMSKEVNEKYKGTKIIFSRDGNEFMLGINGVYHQIFPFVVQELPAVFNQ